MAREEREGAEAAREAAETATKQAQAARDEAQVAREEAQAAREGALRAARQARFLGMYLPAENMLLVTDVMQQVDRTKQYKWPLPDPLRRAFLMLARREGHRMSFREFCDTVTNANWPVETPNAGPSDDDRREFECSGAGRLWAAVGCLRREGVLLLSKHPDDVYWSTLGVDDSWVPAIEDAFATYE